MKTTKFFVGATTLAATSLLLAACSSPGSNTTAPSSNSNSSAKTTAQRACVILPDTTSSPRYESGDRPALSKALAAGGFKADIQNAQGSVSKYVQIAQTQLTQGCGVMILDDLNGAGATVLNKARAQGVPVIAYDRPILKADYYVSFDNEKVGELEGQFVVDGLKAEGKDPSSASVVCMSGDPTDGNAAYFKAGALKAMGAAGIKCAASPLGTWDATKSGTEFQQAYTALRGNVDAVWTANDANNAAVITVLNKNGKTIPTSGQDASPAGLQNILLGKQYGTVYKPYQLEAKQASDLAIALLKGQKPKAPATQAGVPFYPETPISVTLSNINVPFKDGNAAYADVCTTSQLKKLCSTHGITN